MAGGPGHATHHARSLDELAGPEESGTAVSPAGETQVPAVMWVAARDGGEPVPGAFQPSWLSPQEVTSALSASPGQRPLLGGAISEDTLWSCTTCGACMEECPVLIEHVPKIIAMRRSLVLDEGRMPKGAETALRNIESAGNPYGLSQNSRLQWTEGLEVRTAAHHPGAEYLYWVGCAASYDERARIIARSLVRILNAAGVDYSVLGTEERCTGDPARRIGSEYLFQEQAKSNVAVLGKHAVRKVIATCPHCFNTLSSEYGEFGGNYEVIHHTQLITQLLREGRLKLRQDGAERSITYHDSCYLGRWNDIFAPPRTILEQIPGLQLLEMKRNRNEGMCCGAGGGRMWMEESKPRVNHERVAQAAETGAAGVATACPFCLTMFDEGISARGEKLTVDDIAVYVAEALEPAPGDEGGAATAGARAGSGSQGVEKPEPEVQNGEDDPVSPEESERGN